MSKFVFTQTMAINCVVENIIVELFLNYVRMVLSNPDDYVLSICDPSTTRIVNPSFFVSNFISVI